MKANRNTSLLARTFGMVGRNWRSGKVLVFAMALTLVVPGAFAQNVSYKVVKDNPEDALVDLYIGLDPLWMELGGQNLLSMGWGAYAFYNLNQDLMFEAELKLPYHRRWIDAEFLEVDEKGKPTKEDYFNDYKPAKLIQFNLTGHWTFASKTKGNRPMKAHVKTEYSGDYKIESYLPFRGTKKRLYQLRGGLFYNRTVVHRDVPDLRSDDAAWQAATEPETDGWNVVPYSNLSYVALFGGINISRVWEAQVDISEYGTRTTRAHNTFYIDVMLAPAMNLRKLKAGDLEYDLVENGHFAKQNLGWRIGWAGLPDYKNLVWGTEIGNRPGIYALNPDGTNKDGFNRGVYWNFWMIFSLFNHY